MGCSDITVKTPNTEILERLAQVSEQLDRVADSLTDLSQHIDDLSYEVNTLAGDLLRINWAPEEPLSDEGPSRSEWQKGSHIDSLPKEENEKDQHSPIAIRGNDD